MESGSNYLKNNITRIKEKLNNKIDINWEDEHLKDWKSKAEEKQQFYLESLGGRDWEEYQTDQVHFLRLKIGFAIFGPSADVDDENNDEPEIHFKDTHQKKTIDQITEAIYKICESKHVYAAFIFVIAFVNNEYAEYPVIRILYKESDSILFTDMLGRVYKDWNDFISNNTFPSCICCYPKNGFYSCGKDGKVELSFDYSPESSKLKRFLRKMDTVNGVAGVGSAAVGIAALAVPMSGPVVLGSAAAGLASAAWSTCRTVTTLRDRKKHYQTLSVSDRNARACWISLAAGIVGGASAGAVQYTEVIARTGLALNRIPCLAANTLEIGNIAIGGLSVINHIVNIVNKEDCTLSDSVQVVLSILFFFHASVSFITAKAIMRNFKSKILNNVEKELNNKQQNEFIMRLQKTWESSEGENVKVIKTLKTIKNEETFFHELLEIGQKSKGSMTESLVVIHEKTNICTTDLTLTNNVAQAKLTDSTTKLFLDSELQQLQAINATSKQESLLIMKYDIDNKLNVKSLNDLGIDSHQLLATASSADIYMFNKTVEAIETIPKNSNSFEKLLVEIKKVVRTVSCKSLHEFILLIQSILKKYEEYKLAYETIKKILDQVKSMRLKSDLKKKDSPEGNNCTLVASLDEASASCKEQ